MGESAAGREQRGEAAHATGRQAGARRQAGHGHGHDQGDHDHDNDRAGHIHDGGGPARGGHGHQHGVAGADAPGALRVLAIGSLVLATVAGLELGVAVATRSSAVLADGLHNLGDVSTTLALGAAFVLSRRAPTRRFPYGYHRGEDLAGLVVLLLIVASAVASGATSIEHLLHRHALVNPAAALVVAIVGFAGNESVAMFKSAAGRRLHSVALIADGQHSRVDGLASLGAAAGVLGAWLGAPVLDPVAGLVITGVIAVVAWDTGRNVCARLLDASDESLVSTIRDAAQGIPGVVAVNEVRARWTGRKVRAELLLAVSPDETVARAHEMGELVRHELYHRIESLADVVVHLDPAEHGDEAHELTRHHMRGSGPG